LDSKTFALLWQSTATLPYKMVGYVVEVNPNNGQFTFGDFHEVFAPWDILNGVFGTSSFSCEYQHNQQILCACSLLEAVPVGRVLVIKVRFDINSFDGEIESNKCDNIEKIRHES
jgi:hypothetical protein